MGNKKIAVFALAAFSAAVSLYAADSAPASAKEPEGYTQNKYSANMEDLSGIDFDCYKMPFYTGTVFPEAQNAVYSDKFIPLKEVSIVLGPDIKKDDLRVAVLQRKLEKWGVKTELVSKTGSKKVQILLNVPDAGKPAPDKSEGYSINCTSRDAKEIIAINGKDKRGLLWGIVSMLQLTKREGYIVTMRSAEITDYPDNASRGSLVDIWPRVYEVAIFAKLNCIVSQGEPWMGGEWNWRTPGAPIMAVQRNAQIFNKLGLDYYTRANLGSSEPKLIASKEKEFEQLKYVVEHYVAAYNINFYFAYDDCRFPLPEQDKAKFGSAAEADVYILNRLYKEVKKDYPDFKMVFCPPYYWTVGIDKNMYKESGIDYVKTLGAKLNPEIGVYWTGVHVVESKFDKASVSAFSTWINRKPWIFKNRPGEHMAVRSLPADATEWGAKGMSYDGFEKDVEAFQLNTFGSAQAVMMATLGDFLWNTKAYNAERSAKNAVGLMLSPAVYPAMKTFSEKTKIFDVYAPPSDVPRASDVSASNIKMLEEALNEMQKSLDSASAVNPDGIASLSTCGQVLAWSKDLVKASKDPKLLTGNPIKAIAKKDIPSLSPKDLFIPPVALFGAVGVEKSIASVEEKRPAKSLYPAKTKFPTLSLAYIGCDPYPASNDWVLYISGAADREDCPIEIKFNGKLIYEGACGFAKDKWTLKSFKIPMSIVEKRDNVLTISNKFDSDSEKGPLVHISYAVLERF